MLDFVKKVLCKLYSIYASGKVKQHQRLKVHYPAKIVGSNSISIGDGFVSARGLVLECIRNYRDQSFSPQVSIGARALLGEYCHIGCTEQIIIGDNFTCGRNVTIIDHDHGVGSLEEQSIPPLSRKLTSKGGIEIGNNVWIADHVVVLSGVKIGNNVTIGANAVVTHDIPDNSVAGGIPARVLRNK